MSSETMEKTIKKPRNIPRSVFTKSGKKGGTKTAERGTVFYKGIGKLGASARWNKNDNATNTQKRQSV